MKLKIFKVVILIIFSQGPCVAQMTLGNLYVGNTLQDKDSISRQDRYVFDISSEQWLTKPNEIELKPYSWGFSFTRMFEYPFSNKFSLAFGLGLRSLHHYHNGEFAKYVQPTDGITDSLVPIHNSISYSINKTALNFVDAAVDIRIKAGKKNKFKFYMGFKGGYLYNEHIKYKDSSIKYKKYSNNGFNKFSFGPTIRIGINNVCIYGNYLLSPIYENNSGQKIESISVGITLFFL